MPAWVETGFAEYQKRLGGECRLLLTEVAAGSRRKSGDSQRILKMEGDKMMKVVPAGAHVVALDSCGKQWDTPGAAEALSRWMHLGCSIALLIGGPEGLADSCRQNSREFWSLSRLTFPHPLVRIIVAEQLYRAWSLLHNHPYHR